MQNFAAICEGDGKLSYIGCPLHRIVTDFMVQGGDITKGDGTGGMSIYGPSFPDENLTITHRKRGMLSMANHGKDTNNSQFFITLDETPWLNGIHTVFGEIEDDDESEMCLKLLNLGGSASGKPT